MFALPNLLRFLAQLIHQHHPRPIFLVIGPNYTHPRDRFIDPHHPSFRHRGVQPNYLSCCPLIRHSAPLKSESDDKFQHILRLMQRVMGEVQV